MNTSSASETDSFHAERYALACRIENLKADSKVWPPLQSARFYSEEIAMAELSLAHVERCISNREGR